MIVGYARTSILDQTAGLDVQQDELRAAGCERIFVEQVSSVDMKEREKLTEAMEFIRDGDTLVVTKLDRLARSVRHLADVTDEIAAKGASLRILSMSVDTTGATGKFLLNILGSVAEFEREIMLERQREGIARAQRAGKYKGRKPTAFNKQDDVLALVKDGIGATEIARRTGISRASVYRILAKANSKAGVYTSGEVPIR